MLQTHLVALLMGPEDLVIPDELLLEKEEVLNPFKLQKTELALGVRHDGGSFVETAGSLPTTTPSGPCRWAGFKALLLLLVLAVAVLLGVGSTSSSGWILHSIWQLISHDGQSHCVLLSALFLGYARRYCSLNLSLGDYRSRSTQTGRRLVCPTLEIYCGHGVARRPSLSPLALGLTLSRFGSGLFHRSGLPLFIDSID